MRDQIEREAGSRAEVWVLDDSRVPPSGADRSVDPPIKPDELKTAVERLFSGALVNASEGRPALHMALRSRTPQRYLSEQSSADLLDQRARFLAVADRLYSGESGLSDLIHIGMGGSDLGPRLLAEACQDPKSAVTVHFLSTLDYRKLQRLLRTLDPARTGLIVASKSFSTEETLLQARSIAAWLGDYFGDQAWAATARADRAVDFGFRSDSVLTFAEWTGGRFSMWSSVGMAAAAAIGRQQFEQLLAGAERADDDFYQSSTEGRVDQLSHQLAFLIHDFRRKLGLPTLGIVSYEPRLGLLGDYLQQLLMESLGKRVDQSDQILGLPTAPLVFACRGTDGQHSVFQALHQGFDNHPLLMIGALEDDEVDPEWQQTQLAHLLGQIEALNKGVTATRACQDLPGKRPVAVLMTERLTAEGLGYLLASFEHAVFVLSVIWNVNPFDQWGVEEGKRLASAFKKKLAVEPFDLKDLSRAGNFLKDSE